LQGNNTNAHSQRLWCHSVSSVYEHDQKKSWSSATALSDYATTTTTTMTMMNNRNIIGIRI